MPRGIRASFRGGGDGGKVRAGLSRIDHDQSALAAPSRKSRIDNSRARGRRHKTLASRLFFCSNKNSDHPHQWEGGAIRPTQAMKTRPGKPYPLGATWDGAGVNFALASENATSVEVCLFGGEDGNQQQ